MIWLYILAVVDVPRCDMSRLVPSKHYEEVNEIFVQNVKSPER